MVDSLSEGLAALRADRIHDLLGGLGARTIGERDMRPGTSELFANDRTDAAASSRNDRDPALECLPHHASSPCICINSCDIPRDGSTVGERKIGRAHVGTPVTNAQLVCRLLLAKKKQ